MKMATIGFRNDHDEEPSALLYFRRRLVYSQNDENDILRVWDLNTNSSRYEYIEAATSDDALKIMWSSWSVVSWIVSAFTSVVLLSMLSSRRVRRNAFNTYLIFLVFPDFVFSFGCAITCMMNIMKGHYFSNWMCKTQQFYIVFGIAANAWLNLVVAWQIYDLLRKSTKNQNYTIPSRRMAIRQSLMVYAKLLPFRAKFAFLEALMPNQKCFIGLSSCQCLSLSPLWASWWSCIKSSGNNSSLA